MRRITGLMLIGILAFMNACDLNSPSGPAADDSEVELFSQFVESKEGGTKIDWGGSLLNRSEFVVQVAVKLEMFNADSVKFYTTSEELFEVGFKSQRTFTVETTQDEIPTPVLSSLAFWNMTHRLVSFKGRFE